MLKSKPKTNTEGMYSMTLYDALSITYTVTVFSKAQFNCSNLVYTHINLVAIKSILY